MPVPEVIDAQTGYYEHNGFRCLIHTYRKQDSDKWHWTWVPAKDHEAPEGAWLLAPDGKSDDGHQYETREDAYLTAEDSFRRYVLAFWGKP